MEQDGVVWANKQGKNLHARLYFELYPVSVEVTKGWWSLLQYTKVGIFSKHKSWNEIEMEANRVIIMKLVLQLWLS